MTRPSTGLFHNRPGPLSPSPQCGHGRISARRINAIQVVGGMDFIPGGELSRRIREGDVSAESELIRQFEPGLRVLLRRRTGGDQGLLQDLVQETLLVVIQRLRGNGIDDPQKLAAFAAQTARNLAIASLRKAERQRTDVDSEATERKPDSSLSVEGLAGDLEAALAVRALLRELPQARDRLMLKRFYLDDQDKQQICQEMQLTEAAFNQALSRARRRFRQILEERGFAKRDLLNLGL
jgi:RNA polymerase sigma-70 factor, ECF subfamily